MLVIACLALVAGQVFLLWTETGRATLTRYFDPQRTVKERAARELAALFDDNSDEFLDQNPNRFRLGMLPAGTDKHAISVLTLATPLLIALILLLTDWRAKPDLSRRKSSHKKSGPASGTPG